MWFISGLSLSSLGTLGIVWTHFVFSELGRGWGVRLKFGGEISDHHRCSRVYNAQNGTPPPMMQRLTQTHRSVRQAEETLL